MHLNKRLTQALNDLYLFKMDGFDENQNTLLACLHFLDHK